MISPALLESRMSALIQNLTRAHDAALDGKAPDLKPLKAEADSLCAAILRLPPAEARDFQSLIGEAIGTLDAIEQALKQPKESP
ncbi:MAG TPA: hypothetical protein PLO23_07425 [Alphaproteobacteria bacterium]|nr:hypothetical protein [Alphaproteobacteria bacterium]